MLTRRSRAGVCSTATVTCVHALAPVVVSLAMFVEEHTRGLGRLKGMAHRLALLSMKHALSKQNNLQFVRRLCSLNVCMYVVCVDIRTCACAHQREWECGSTSIAALRMRVCRVNLHAKRFFLSFINDDSSAILLEIPLAIVERTHLSCLEPP